jgi:hypothetical protein
VVIGFGAAEGLAEGAAEGVDVGVVDVGVVGAAGVRSDIKVRLEPAVAVARLRVCRQASRVAAAAPRVSSHPVRQECSSLSVHRLLASA